MNNCIISPIIETIKPKRGIGVIVILSLLLFTAWLALIGLFIRIGGVKLSDVPTVRLAGKLHLGNAAVWGVIIGIFGVGAMSVFFTIDNPDGGDKALLWVVAVPLVLTAFFLFVFQTLQNQLPSKIDLLLQNAWVDKKIVSSKAITNKQITITKIDISGLMSEFERYKVVQFHMDDNGDYVIDAFHHIVEHYFAENPIKCGGANAASWVCKGCGAANTTLNCEYCGTRKPD